MKQSGILIERLLYLTPYLDVARKGIATVYSLFHRSLSDWLVDQEVAERFWCHRETGESDVADACWQDYTNDVEQMTEDGVRYPLLHRRAASHDAKGRILSDDKEFHTRRLQFGAMATKSG